MFVGRFKNGWLQIGRWPARVGSLAAACLLAVLAVGLAAPVARAEGEDEAGGDARAKIKAKMERILRLMRENEEALLKLSTGSSAATRKVDVDVPPPQDAGNAGSDSSGSGSSGSGSSGSGSSGSGSSGSESGAESGSASGTSGTSGGSPAGTGAEVVRGLDDITRSSGGIPDELKQLVEMIPT